MCGNWQGRPQRTALPQSFDPCFAARFCCAARVARSSAMTELKAQGAKLTVQVEQADDSDISSQLSFEVDNPSYQDVATKVADFCGRHWTDIVLLSGKGNERVWAPDLADAGKNGLKFRTGETLPGNKLKGATRKAACIFANKLLSEIAALERCPPERVQITAPSREASDAF